MGFYPLQGLPPLDLRVLSQMLTNKLLKFNVWPLFHCSMPESELRLVHFCCEINMFHSSLYTPSVPFYSAYCILARKLAQPIF
jgi:hypothetical protein